MTLTNGMFDRTLPAIKKRFPEISDRDAAELMREVLAGCVVCQVCDGGDGVVEDLRCRDCEDALHYYD